jgi:hypothetical protein
LKSLKKRLSLINEKLKILQNSENDTDSTDSNSIDRIESILTTIRKIFQDIQNRSQETGGKIKIIIDTNKLIRYDLSFDFTHINEESDYTKVTFANVEDEKQPFKVNDSIEKIESNSSSGNLNLNIESDKKIDINRLHQHSNEIKDLMNEIYNELNDHGNDLCII